MDIRFSRYNAPFSELCEPGVHYISLDDQRDVFAGRFNAHVRLYRSLPVSRVIEVFNPLTGISYVHHVTGTGFFRPFNSSPSVDCSPVDIDFLSELRRSRVAASVPALSRCTCGNANRPWRCICNK